MKLYRQEIDAIYMNWTRKFEELIPFLVYCMDFQPMAPAFIILNLCKHPEFGSMSQWWLFRLLVVIDLKVS